MKPTLFSKFHKVRRSVAPLQAAEYIIDLEADELSSPEIKILERVAMDIVKVALAVGFAASAIALHAQERTAEASPANPYDIIEWKGYQPVDPKPASEDVVTLKITSTFLRTPGVIRRDPSDVIRVGDTYYLWYTKVPVGALNFPGGWTGTLWYATSKDGHEWEEQGQALDKGAEGVWDSAGVYTNNIMVYQGKYYIAYTAMSFPFSREHSQASIGMAVADFPDGPWIKFDNNPMIRPSENANDPDGYLCDDSVFVARNDKIWLYYKGYRRAEEDGRPIRAGRQTYILAATAAQPEGPYTKIPQVLHLGHEAVLWKDVDSVGSFCTRSGPTRYFSSKDGVNFRTMNLLSPLKALGLYRADFEEGSKGARATWGVAAEKGQGNGTGLYRFEIHWPD